MQAFPKERKGNIFFGRNLAILSMMRVEEEEEKNAVTRKSELFLVVKQLQEQKTVTVFSIIEMAATPLRP